MFSNTTRSGRRAACSLFRPPTATARPTRPPPRTAATASVPNTLLLARKETVSSTRINRKFSQLPSLVRSTSSVPSSSKSVCRFHLQLNSSQLSSHCHSGTASATTNNIHSTLRLSSSMKSTFGIGRAALSTQCAQMARDYFDLSTVRNNIQKVTLRCPGMDNGLDSGDMEEDSDEEGR